MEKHPYDQLIETVADKMKQHEEDNLGFGIFEKVDKNLGLGRGTAWVSVVRVFGTKGGLN